MTVPTIAPIMTQQKSNMTTSCKYNKTKSNFKNLDVLLYFCYKWSLRQSLSQKIHHGFVNWQRTQKRDTK